VAGWAQVDGRVQVWFRKPLTEGSVEWLGTFAPSPGGKPVPDPLPVEPPVPTLVHMKPTGQVLRVHAEDGWAVRVDRDAGWTASAAGRELRFKADGPAAPVRLLLFPPRGGPARGFGLVEVGGNGVSYRAAVEAPVPPNRPHHLVLRVAGLPRGAAVTLEVPPGTAAHDRSADDGEREWDLDVSASPATRVRLAVVVRLPEAGTVRLPEVGCGVGGAGSEPGGIVHAVGVTGAKPGVHLDGATPASPAELASIQARWPGEAERLRRAGGSAWVVTGRPALVVPAAAPPVPKAAPAKPAAATPSASSTPAVSVPELRRPVLGAAGWCGVVLAVGVLFARAPRLTWPEQVGLLGGLFGLAVAGGWLVGAAAYGLARLTWLTGRVTS
jgi:hypothetical protein